MTTIKSAEIDAYVAAVGAALTDLPDEMQADLLEDLPDHLAEVLAEGDGTLHERLGDPAAYAAELRAAVGYRDEHNGPIRLDEMVALIRTRIASANHIAGAIFGYRTAVAFGRALQPGWWILRGWVVALIVKGAFLHGHWTSFVQPLDDGPAINGWLLIAPCVLASIWIGRLTARGNAQTRAVAGLVSLTIAIFGFFIARNIVGWDYQKYGPQGADVIYRSATPSPAPTLTYRSATTTP
jgi:hypothetical protein